MNTLQSDLPKFRVSQRVVFVGIETIRANTGHDAETICNMVDRGEYRWVFDVALPDCRRRELRFWVGEFIAREMVANQDASEVIAAILGREEFIRRGEIERQWICSTAHLGRLIEIGELTLATKGRVTRNSLTTFLHRRLQH